MPNAGLNRKANPHKALPMQGFALSPFTANGCLSISATVVWRLGLGSSKNRLQKWLAGLMLAHNLDSTARLHPGQTTLLMSHHTRDGQIGGS